MKLTKSELINDFMFYFLIPVLSGILGFVRYQYNELLGLFYFMFAILCFIFATIRSIERSLRK